MYLTMDRVTGRFPVGIGDAAPNRCRPASIPETDVWRTWSVRGRAEL